jgi:hypothetical protein
MQTPEGTYARSALILPNGHIDYGFPSIQPPEAAGVDVLSMPSNRELALLQIKTKMADIAYDNVSDDML